MVQMMLQRKPSGPGIAFFRHHYAHRDEAARDWAARGLRVIGSVGQGAPLATIRAAGHMPYRLSGDPALELTLVRRHLYASFNKGQSERPIRLDWVEAIIERLLNGHYDFIGELLIPYVRKEIAQIHTKLRDVARDWPQFALPPSCLLDHALLDDDRARAFNAARLADYAAHLGLDQAVDDDAALAEQRDLMRRMQALRGVWIGGSDALAIMATARTMPVEQHNEALRDMLAGDLEPVCGTRVFVGGSVQDTDGLYRLIEAGGGQVVGENHDWGQRMFEADAPPTLSVPQSLSVAQCLERAKACDAEAAIYCVHADDAWQIWEAPDEMAALEAAGLPVLHLAGQSYREPADGAQIAAFLA